MKRTAGLRCTICSHPARPQIDLAIATGLSQRAVAARFAVSRDAVWRHGKAHLTVEMRAALATKLLQREGDTRRILLEEGAGVSEALKAIRGPLFGLFLAAVDTGDHKAAASLAGRLHENLAIVAKLTGELAPQAGTNITNVLLSTDYQRLRAELVRVLACYPEAQAEVAAVFRQAGLRAAAEIRATAGKTIEALPIDLAHALDPVAFMQDRLNFQPDPWQAPLLGSCARWILLNCCRQSGKSTTTAAVALHTAIYDPGLILLVSPSLRQSKELFAKVTGFLKDLEPAEVLEEDNKSCCTLANGARLVSLPGDPDTLRGYSAPKLIIKDEAAFVSDAMQAALDPMLAVSKGRLIEMSSPNGKRGHFYENWQHGVGLERIKIIGRECPRIGAEFLEKMRQKLGPMLFAQEFEGEFIDAESSAFSSEMIELALVNDFERFIT